MTSTSGNVPGRVGDKWTVASMLVITGALLGLIIFLGWERLIRPFTPTFAWPLAASITALAGLVAQHVGVRWYRDAVEAEETGRKPGYRWLLSYPAFFFISALGVINVAFYYFEGPAVLKQNIDEAEQAFSALSSTAQVELRNVTHEEKGDHVRQLLATLTNEINNPNGQGHCGVGPVARITIDKIRSYLPTFDEFSGSSSSTDCSKAPELAERYSDEAEKLLSEDPDFAREGGPDRVTYLAKLNADSSKANDQFNQAREALDASAFMSRGNAYGIAKASLESAAISYNDDRQRLDRLTGHSHSSLPVTLDLGASRDLGSFATILHSLFRRITHFSIWSYILSAIALDYAVVRLVKNVHIEFADVGRRGTAVRRNRASSGPIRVQTEPGTGPRFLWVNPD